jgi:N utilization substance protein A
MVVNELKGEKIDVVEWSDDSARFVAKALAPASVKEVRIDEETGTASVIVPDYQLSLAIGKEGQNARLAARLTGWRIDIKSESQAAEEASTARSRRAQPAAESEPETPPASEAGPEPPQEPQAPDTEEPRPESSEGGPQADGEPGDPEAAEKDAQEAAAPGAEEPSPETIDATEAQKREGAEA